MSVDLTVYVGPFAEFVFPAGAPHVDWLDAAGDALAPAGANSAPEEHTGTDGRKYCTVRFVPNAPRSWCSRKTRDMRFGEQESRCVHLSELQIPDERVWLRTSYAAELAKLSVAYGMPPDVRWGVVQWCD